MDTFHKTFDVYTEPDAAGNHFPARGRMSSAGDDTAVLNMDEACADNPHSGSYCILARFLAWGDNWGGWYFANGTLQGDEVAPSMNWGEVCDAGLDLRGAGRLTFWARGARGGEQVEFFCFGVGRDALTCEPTCEADPCCPDGECKESTGFVSLTTGWKRFEISLAGKTLDYVLGGFGWVTNAPGNQGQDITFYLDDIQYTKDITDQPRFVVSYETTASPEPFDQIMRNTAFTYDNAITLLAFLATGQQQRAKLLADAFVYAQANDRWFDDGRLRNAYQGGDLVLWRGWTPHGRIGTVRMPGWYDATHSEWFEDYFQVGTSTGNAAWAMIALLAYYVSDPQPQYLSSVEDLGAWVDAHCKAFDTVGGYTGGYERWEPQAQQTPLTYKSTEHNLDLYAAFRRLYLITNDAKWENDAQHAKAFVQKMWDPMDRKFWTGTKDDGITINEDVIPLDIQVWAQLALLEEAEPYKAALDYVENHHRYGDGYDFNGRWEQQVPDGVWYEGTAQVACAYYYLRNSAKGDDIVSFLLDSRWDNDALPAASKDGLTTGFNLSTGDPWLYYQRAHIAATAWGALAQNKANPFWLDIAHR